MRNTTHLDILVVYTSAVASSASTLDTIIDRPFPVDSAQNNYNRSYSYMLDACQRLNLNAGFTTSGDVTGPGQCSTYWVCQQGIWSKVRNPAKATQIFDKLSPISPERIAQRTLLLSGENVQPFNSRVLHAIFFDKLKTYRAYKPYTIPTVAVSDSTVPALKKTIQRLAELVTLHPHSADFSTAVVLKDRNGAGGNHVYKFAQTSVNKIAATMRANPEITFVLQPFLQFDKGFSYKNSRTATDIRLIIHRNQIFQSYLRLAKTDEFRCNEHQGGQLFYVSEQDLPPQLLTTAAALIATINKPRSLYALDFSISNTGTIYLMEGNIGPGLDWDAKKPGSEKMSKALIRRIVTEMGERVSLTN